MCHPVLANIHIFLLQLSASQCYKSHVCGSSKLNHIYHTNPGPSHSFQMNFELTLCNDKCFKWNPIYWLVLWPCQDAKVGNLAPLFMLTGCANKPYNTAKCIQCFYNYVVAFTHTKITLSQLYNSSYVWECTLGITVLNRVRIMVYQYRYYLWMKTCRLVLI